METILLVGDESDSLATAREVLKGEGFQILDALNAEEAVRVAAAYGGPIHLLLTDVVMPGASGQDLAQLLGIQRPDLRVLYMATFAIVQGRQQFAETENGLDLGTPIVLKPFTGERLMEKVQEVLAAKPPSQFDHAPDPWRNVCGVSARFPDAAPSPADRRRAPAAAARSSARPRRARAARSSPARASRSRDRT
jgi:CheY-like chemotaxis protein